MKPPPCPSLESLAGLLRGTLEVGAAEDVAQHLDSCSSCREALEAASHQEGGVIGRLRSSNCEDETSDSNDQNVLASIRENAKRAFQELGDSAINDSLTNRSSDPETLGNYRIIRQIGRGGMGIVYEAEQIGLGRSVALKILPTQMFQQSKSVLRFQREAAAAASLHHTNIVPVFEAGESDGTWFYAMQLIEGCGLDFVRNEIKRARTDIGVPTKKQDTDDTFLPMGALASSDQTQTKTNSATDLDQSVKPFDLLQVLSGLANNGETDRNASLATAASLQQQKSNGQNNATKSFENARLLFSDSHYRAVAEIGRQAAGALHHAHQRGIVHRDVKPSNLILDHSGIVWLADFGLAKHFDDGLTGTNDAPGTLRYMSPERFQGKADSTSDIYALGVTLFELLTLERIFTGSDQLSLMQKIREQEPVKPCAIDRAIPFDLQTIVLKAIAKDPSRRYQSAKAFQEDLNCFLNGQPISARRVGTLERLWLWARKRKSLAASLAAIAFLILATAIGSSIAAFRFNKQRIEKTELADANFLLATQKAAESKKAIRQRDVAYQNAYFADVRQAHQDWHNGQLQRMLTTLKSYVPVSPAQDVRGWEWYYLLSLANQDEKTLLDHDGTITQVGWSPDGNRLLSIASDNMLMIWSRNGELEKKISIPGVRHFAFNADGSQFAVVSGDAALRIFNTADGSLSRAIKTELESLGGVDWSKQDDRIAVSLLSKKNADILVLNAATEEVITRKTLDFQHPVHELKFSPSGKYLGIVFDGSCFDVFDIENESCLYSRRFSDTRELNELQAMAFAWHPDGKKFAVGTYQEGLRLFEIEAGKLTPKTIDIFQDDTSFDAVEFSPDGKQLLAGNRAQRIEVYDLSSKTSIQTLKGHLNSIRSLSQHPTQELIASGANDGSIKFWKGVNAATQPNGYNFEADIIKSGKSPDGKWSWETRGSNVLISDSTTNTFSNNQSMSGVGGAVRRLGTLTATNSTFSNNNARDGGAIAVTANNSSTSIDHCTFVANSGAGIYCSNSPPVNSLKFEVLNSIFADNVGRGSDELMDVKFAQAIPGIFRNCIYEKLEGGLIEASDNLIGVDAQLGPLADNGGSTKTHALLVGSPAIDAAGQSKADLSREFDQRGEPFLRAVDGDEDNNSAADIGAFEFASEAD